MRNITLDEYIKKGEGGTATCYFHKDNDDIMLKLFEVDNNEYMAKEEFQKANVAYNLGLPTPKTIELVICEGQFGIIYEKIKNKKSYAKLCVDNPEYIEKYATSFAKACKKLHETKMPENLKVVFTKKSDIYRKDISKSKFSEESKLLLLKLLDETKEEDYCVHGDLHLGNIVNGWCDSIEKRSQKENDECQMYYIDMDSFSYGNPLFDLGRMYYTCVINAGTPLAIFLMHLNKEQSLSFWKHFSYEYFGTKDEKKLEEIEKTLLRYSSLNYLNALDRSKNPEDVKVFDEKVKKLLEH